MKLFTWANALTLCNLFSGSLACIMTIKGYELTNVGICILISLVCDFLDGFVARLTNTSGELGTQLDSLADMVSFGLLPGLLMMKNLKEVMLLGSSNWRFVLLYSSLFITLFSALRLAKFNIDTEQSNYFKGLNTPTNTIAIFSIAWIDLNNMYLLIGVLILSCYLLTSNIPMFSFKLKGFNLKKDYYLPAFLALSLIALIIYGIPALSFIIIGYILTSIIFKSKFTT